MNTFAVSFALLLISFAIPTRCTYDDGDCVIRATYDTFRNKTYWTAACDDGYIGEGTLGGNAVPDICGA